MSDDILVKKLAALETRLNKLATFDTGRVIPLIDPVLIYSDSTARNNAFTTLITVASVGGLPAVLRGIWYQAVFTTTITQNAYLDIIHPDKTAGGAALGAGQIGQWIGGGFVGVASSGANVGKISLTVNGSANPVFTGIFIRVMAYLI